MQKKGDLNGSLASPHPTSKVHIISSGMLIRHFFEQTSHAAMKRHDRGWQPFILAMVVLFLGVQSSGAQDIVYPKAPTVSAIEELHGHHISDPYQWMENLDHPDLQPWLQAQEHLLRGYVGAGTLQSELEARILELQTFTTYSAPTVAGNRYFYNKVSTSGRWSTIYMRKGWGGEEQVVLDLSTARLTVNSYYPSPKGKFVAAYVGEGQSRWSKLHLVNVETGETQEVLDGLHSFSGPVAWDQTGSGFYYNRIDPEEGEASVAGKLKAPRIFYHRIGTSQAEDQLIYERPDEPSWLFSLATTLDNRYVVLNVTQGQTGGTGVFYLDREAAQQKVVELVQGAGVQYTFLGSERELFYLYTTEDAPNGRIIRVNTQTPAIRKWHEVVPEKSETISGNSQVGGNGVTKVGQHLAVLYVKDALPLVRVYSLEGELEYELDLPGVGSMWGGFFPALEEDAVYYRYLALTTPGDVYRLDLKTGALSVTSKADLPVKTDDFEGKQVFFTSADGTRVPMLLVHKKGITLDGNNPVFMYGYGAYAWVSFVWYQPHIVAWLEMGGVYALPQIRGGGEYGKTWAEGGSGLNKPNTIMDYIGATEWLIANGYTRSDRMIANGGSASAMLPAATINQNRDLYGGAVIDIPLLDLMRYHHFSGAQYWLAEYGTVDDQDSFEAIRSYSPYHNLDAGACYPPTIVTAGEKDESAPPFHAYKYVARLQAEQGCDHPILLQVVEGAGHTFGTTRKQNARTLSTQLAFLVQALDLPVHDGAFQLSSR